MKYFLYARKSSEPEERQAMSIESQLEELRLFSEREKISISEMFIESKSAKEPGRMEFNRMIDKIKSSNEPIGLISWHPDRLARNSLDGGQIIYLIDIGKIISLKFPTFWFEPTAQGLYMLQVAFGQSKYYSDSLSENVKRGNRQKIRRGEYSGVAPVGYINNFKTKNIEIDPVKSRIVKQLFEEFGSGKLNLHTASERFHLLGVVNKRGTKYTPYMIYRVLTCLTYLGVIKRNEECYDGNFPPIIDKKLFDIVQSRLKERAKPRKTKKRHDFPFRGLFTCGECGCSISAQFAKGKSGGLYRYYRCTKKKGKCSQGYLMENHLAEQVRLKLNDIGISEEWANKMQLQISNWENGFKSEKHLNSLSIEQKINEINIKLDKLVSAFLDELIDKSIYIQKKEELIKSKVDLSNRLKNQNIKPTWIEPLKDWVKTLNSVGKLGIKSNNFDDLKYLIEKTGTNRVLKDKKIDFEFLPPFTLFNKFKALKRKSPDMSGPIKTEEEGLITQNLTWR